MFQVLTDGQMTDKPNTKEHTMDCTWFTNMPWNGWISLRLVMNICCLKFRSSLNCMVNSISQVLMRKSMSQFPICGMKEERFILIRLKKFSSTEWMKPPSSKKKNKQLSESQMYLKLQKPSSISLKQVLRILNMQHAPWLRFFNRSTNLTTWLASWWMDFLTFTDLVGTDHLSTLTIEDCSVTFHHITLLTAECSSIWTVTSWRMVSRWWLVATTLFISTNLT